MGLLPVWGGHDGGPGASCPPALPSACKGTCNGGWGGDRNPFRKCRYADFPGPRQRAGGNAVCSHPSTSLADLLLRTPAGQPARSAAGRVSAPRGSSSPPSRSEHPPGPPTHRDQKKLSPAAKAFKEFVIEQGGPRIAVWA